MKLGILLGDCDAVWIIDESLGTPPHDVVPQPFADDHYTLEPSNRVGFILADVEPPHPIDILPKEA